MRLISEREVEVTLASDVFQYQTEWSLPGIAHQADDNDFDLYPGEPCRVRIQTEQPVTPEQIEKALRVHSLVDSY